MPLALARDWPDPCVLCDAGAYYVYATESAGVNVQCAYAPTPYGPWTAYGDALPFPPAWTQCGKTWAPCVVPASGGWTMYFTACHAATGYQALGVARADTPLGPFYALPVPLLVGFIDADVYTDESGTLILYAAGCDGQEGGIWAQRLTPDGLSLMGEQVKVLRADRQVERGVVEAPTLLKRADDYALLYSVNWYGTSDYAIHYAVAASPFGPFYKPPFNYVLRSGAGIAGPGHPHAFQDETGAWYLAFHAWRDGCVGYDGGHAREFYVEPFDPVKMIVGTP